MDENIKGQLGKRGNSSSCQRPSFASHLTYFEDFFVDLMNSCMDLCTSLNFRNVPKGASKGTVE